MAGFSGLLHHGARASVANGHRTQPVGTIEVSASQLRLEPGRVAHRACPAQLRARSRHANLTHDAARCSAPKLRSPVALLAVVGSTILLTKDVYEGYGVPQ